MKRIVRLAGRVFFRLPLKTRIKLAITLAILSLLSILDVFSLSLLNRTLEGTSSQSLFERWPALCIIALLLVSKNILSALGNLISQKQFESVEKYVGESNLELYLQLSWKHRSKFSESDLLNLIDKAPYAAIQGVLSSAFSFIVELVAAAAILVTLFSANAVVALALTLYFIIVFIVQNRAFGKFTGLLGLRTLTLTDFEQTLIFDFHRLGKLLSVYSPSQLAAEIVDTRRNLIPVRSSQRFVETLPRYYVEAILVFGVGVVAGAAFLIQGAEHVFSALIIFAAGGYRLLPMLGRFQSSLNVARMNLDLAEKSFEFSTLPSSKTDDVSPRLKGDCIVFDRVSFKYPQAKDFALKNFSFRFEPGKKYALVGPSGSGKTTIVDLALGIWGPNKGEIIFPPKLKRAYVPQENFVLHGSLEKNVSLGIAEGESRRKILTALKKANLNPAVLLNKFKGDDQRVNLSGGQKQRLGLARAFYVQHDLLVLDEATSALDGGNEHEVMKLLGKPSENQIQIIVAHRLSTIKDADEILFIDAGSLRASGSWKKLLKVLPSFRTQVKLAGIVGGDQ